MRKTTFLLSIAIICIGAIAQEQIIYSFQQVSSTFIQNENITINTDTTERVVSSQSTNPQLNRIVQQLQQYQAMTNGSTIYPGMKQIQRDLVGHSLAEGVANGYRPEDWCWKIEEGQISQLRIVEVLEKTQNQYLLIVQMRLSKDYYAYDAKVKIKYFLTSQNRWKIDYVVSQGMYIVNTHEYDSYIRSSIIEDGWGGTYCVQFTNQSELSLIVGGDYLTSNGWKRFTAHVPPHGTATAGGLFNGGTVSDYRINFVVRIN